MRPVRLALYGVGGLLFFATFMATLDRLLVRAGVIAGPPRLSETVVPTSDVIQVGIAALYMLLLAATLSQLQGARAAHVESTREASTRTKEAAIALSLARKSSRAHRRLAAAATQAATTAAAAARAATDDLERERAADRETLLAACSVASEALSHCIPPTDGFRGTLATVDNWRDDLQLAIDCVGSVAPHAAVLHAKDLARYWGATAQLRLCLHYIHRQHPTHVLNWEQPCDRCVHVDKV